MVYEHPTISSLGQFISGLAAGNVGANGIPTSSVTQDMEKMVEELTRDFSKHKQTKEAPEEEVVLVTGTTGSLGTYILEKLISTPSIQRIYALNRSGKDAKTTLRERQSQAFKTHGVDGALIDSPKLVLLEGDISLPDLGLSAEQMEEIAGSATSIIHNGAWLISN